MLNIGVAVTLRYYIVIYELLTLASALINLFSVLCEMCK